MRDGRRPCQRQADPSATRRRLQPVRPVFSAINVDITDTIARLIFNAVQTRCWRTLFNMWRMNAHAAMSKEELL
jgi:hypothetical protein